MGILEKEDVIQHSYANVWEAYTNSDLTEGRGRKVHIGYFFSVRDAEKAAKGQGVMGTNGDVEQVSEVSLTIYEDYNEFLDDQKETMKQQALGKLTPEERELLGL